MDGVPTPVTATIFQALRPEDIDQLDLSDPALADRTHVLSYLPLARPHHSGTVRPPSPSLTRLVRRCWPSWCSTRRRTGSRRMLRHR